MRFSVSPFESQGCWVNWVPGSRFVHWTVREYKPDVAIAFRTYRLASHIIQIMIVYFFDVRQRMLVIECGPAEPILVLVLR